MESYAPSSFKEEWLHNLFEMLLQGSFISSLSFIAEPPEELGLPLSPLSDPLSQSAGLVPPIPRKQTHQCHQHPTSATANGVLCLHLTQLLTISEPSNYSHFETLPFLSSQTTPACQLPFCLHHLLLCSFTKMLGSPKLLARASSLS